MSPPPAPRRCERRDTTMGGRPLTLQPCAEALARVAELAEVLRDMGRLPLPVLARILAVMGWLTVNAAVHVWPMLVVTTPGIETHARYPTLAWGAHGSTHAEAPMVKNVCKPMVQPSSPPNGASLHVQKLGRRNVAVIGPQMLKAVGFMPDPKSRMSATWCASTLITASIGVLSATMQVEFSAHAVAAGHENRASMQRTARGRGEHACTRPAPVALLMHVWSGAHEMPLPQLLRGGAMVVGAAAVMLMLHKSMHARGASLIILLIHYCNNKKYMHELLYVIFSLLPYLLLEGARNLNSGLDHLVDGRKRGNDAGHDGKNLHGGFYDVA